MLQKLPPLQTRLSESSGIRREVSGVMPGPVVRQSVMEETSGCFQRGSFAKPCAKKDTLNMSTVSVVKHLLWLKKFG